MKFSSKYHFILIFCLFTICSLLLGQSVELTKIKIIEKANGVILDLQFNEVPPIEDLTAWHANTNWFYLTLYKASGDSSHLSKIKKPNSIREFQVIESTESIQLGLKFTQSIEEYEFTMNDQKNSIMATLHYSRDKLASLDTIKDMDLNRKPFQLSTSLSNWLYFTGAGITTSGIMQQNKSQTTTGISVLLMTFIVDKIWGES